MLGREVYDFHAYQNSKMPQTLAEALMVKNTIHNNAWCLPTAGLGAILLVLDLEGNDQKLFYLP